MIIELDGKKTKGALEIKFVHSFDEETNFLEKLKFNIEKSSIYIDIAKDIVYVGIKKLKGEDLKICVAKMVQEIKKTDYKNLYLSIVINEKELKFEDLIEGVILGDYEFLTYKNKEKKVLNLNIDIKKSKQNDLKEKFEKIKTICENVNLVRDIVNTPPQDYFPKTMAEQAKDIAKKNNLECKIFGEDYLSENGMFAMLAVGRASVHESQLIHLTFKPKESKGKIVLVGKGLTYDCGGLSLKSGAGMVSMKCDKAGASALLGVMNCLNAIDCQYEVHAILGAVENMIGGNAYKPDDVLKAKNGITIEVKNTDAEGRLVLADCLCYAQDNIKDIDAIFDFATLTGACKIALGEHTMAVMGHSKKKKKLINKAAKKSGELVGVLPFNRYFEGIMDSNVAEIVNSFDNKNGSSISASLFLDKFIYKENKKKWLHFDIAGPAFVNKAWGYNPSGASGACVRLVTKYLQNEKL